MEWSCIKYLQSDVHIPALREGDQDFTILHQDRDEGKVEKYGKLPLPPLLALLQSSFGLHGSLGSVGSVAIRALMLNSMKTNVPEVKLEVEEQKSSVMMRQQTPLLQEEKM